MSHTDTQFRYISGDESRTLSSSYRTVSVGNRSDPISGSRRQMAALVRRSSSVASSRRRDVGTVTLRWSERRYSVQELAQEFKRQFPMLVRVEQGCRCSNVNGFRLDVGQVFAVSDRSVTWRLGAVRDSRKNVVGCDAMH